MRLTPLWLLIGCGCAIGLAGAGCQHGDSARPDTGDGRDGGGAVAGPAFHQPTGLAVVGLDELDVPTVFYATAGANGGFGSFPLADAGLASASLELPVITRVTPDQVKPFAWMTIEGTGFTTDPDAAVSAVFEAPGLAPVAVPALVVTPTTLSFTAPVLLGPDGLDASGTATVRVVEVLNDEHVVSSAYAGVLIERLPAIEGGPAPGTLTAMFLLSTSTFAQDALDAAALPLPSGFMGEVGQLVDALETMGVSYQQAASGLAPTVLIPWSGSERPVLDAVTLDLSDRLVFTILRAQVAAIEADLLAEEGAREKSNPYGCVDPNLEGTPEEQMVSLLCETQGHGLAQARLGGTATLLGFQVVTSVYTGFWGGSAATVLAVRSKQAALAFEVVWAGLSGHLSAWMTGQQRPTAGATLSDSGATLADRLLGTGGVIDTLWTMISFGRSYDALVREAAATPIDDPGSDAGGDVGPDVVADTAGDADTDAVSPGTRYEGEATLYGDTFQMEEGCMADPSVELTMTVTGFSGSGTPTLPFGGDVQVTGTLIVTAVSGNCSGSLGLASVTGRIGGLQGDVGFSLESATPPRYEVTLSRGVVESPTRTLTGDVVVEFWPEGRFWFGVDGIIELSEVDTE